MCNFLNVIGVVMAPALTREGSKVAAIYEYDDPNR